MQTSFDIAELRQEIAGVNADSLPNGLAKLSYQEAIALSTAVGHRFDHLTPALRSIRGVLDGASKESKLLRAEWQKLSPSELASIHINARIRFFQALAEARNSSELPPEEITQDVTVAMSNLARIQEVTKQWLDALENSEVIEALAAASVPAVVEPQIKAA